MTNCRIYGLFIFFCIYLFIFFRLEYGLLIHTLSAFFLSLYLFLLNSTFLRRYKKLYDDHLATEFKQIRLSFTWVMKINVIDSKNEGSSFKSLHKGDSSIPSLSWHHRDPVLRKQYQTFIKHVSTLRWTENWFDVTVYMKNHFPEFMT